MPFDVNDDLDFGFLVSLGCLREVLKELNVNGRRWWLASDPRDAAETRYISVGHGCQGCVGRLNTLHFRAPVIGGDASGPTDRLILIFGPTTITAEEPAFYLQDAQMVQDPLDDFCSFYEPLKGALIARLQAEG
ncbi:MAG: hypothetical protein ABSF53_14860 [Terracidiphilus sp.]|jgi:hypothetical protein